LVGEIKADDTSGKAINAEVEELLVKSFEVKWSKKFNFFWFSRYHFVVIVWCVGWFLNPCVAVADLQVNVPLYFILFLIRLGNVRNKEKPRKRLLKNVYFEKHEGFWHNDRVFCPVACLNLNVRFIVVLVTD
jgi:hypothetical protein